MRTTVLLSALLVGLLGGESRAETPTPAPMRLCFVPLGTYDTELLGLAMRGAEYLYGAKATLLPAADLPERAFYKPRKRHRAEKILDHLDQVMPADRCDIIVGITDVDISTTKGKVKDWGILGMGMIRGTACVVSSFRMTRKVDRATQKRRMISTTNHEIGHVLGAPHGGAPGCLMNDAKGTVRTVDKEHGLLCRESRKLIESHTGRRLPQLETFDWQQFLD